MFQSTSGRIYINACGTWNRNRSRTLSPKAISPLPAVAQSISLLKRPNRPTAIFGSDLQAMGVYEAARQLDYVFPRFIRGRIR